MTNHRISLQLYSIFHTWILFNLWSVYFSISCLSLKWIVFPTSMKLSGRQPHRQKLRTHVREQDILERQLWWNAHSARPFLAFSRSLHQNSLVTGTTNARSLPSSTSKKSRYGKGNELMFKYVLCNSLFSWVFINSVDGFWQEKSSLGILIYFIFTQISKVASVVSFLILFLSRFLSRYQCAQTNQKLSYGFKNPLWVRK